MDREAWQAIVHGVTKSQTRLVDYTIANSLVSGEQQGDSAIQTQVSISTPPPPANSPRVQAAT